MPGFVRILDVRRIAALALLALCSEVYAFAQDPLLWGELKAGAYAVGYRSFFALDESRGYDGKGARPVLFNVWYPAAGGGSAKLNYQAYFDVPHLDVYPQLGGRLRSHARNIACEVLFGRKSESLLRSRERKAFNRLLAARTAAGLNMREAPGRFPIVLYHPGSDGSFEENSVLFEYLASFGYIVVSSAFQSPDSNTVSNNVGGIERSGADLTFIARQALKWPNADPEKVAAIGHSAGAQYVLQWIGAPPCPASAIVDLDSTMEYDELLRFHKRTLAAMEKLVPPKVPVLLLARTTPKPKFSAFDNYLRFATRYEGEAAHLEHDDFLSHGFLGRALMGSTGAERVRRSYEEVCRAVKAFLDSKLGDSPSGNSFPPPHSPASPVSVRYRPEAIKGAP